MIKKLLSITFDADGFMGPFKTMEERENGR